MNETIVAHGNDFDVLKSEELHQIYFEDWQRDHLFMFAKPYFNDKLTPFFENTVIAELVTGTKADKIAVCSWALSQKMKLRIPPRRELTEDAMKEDFDVMSFTKNSSDHDMLVAFDGWHRSFSQGNTKPSDILRMIFTELGMNMPRRVKFPIYQNAFCARTEIYREYVTNFLIPAMEVMTHNEEIKKLCMEDTGYRVTTLNIPVDGKRLEKMIGIPYYPLHPFLLERCFSLWINNRNLKVVYL